MADGEGAAPRPAPSRRAPSHAAIVRELRARFGDAAAGPSVAIYLAARGYDPGQTAAILAELAGAPPADDAGDDAGGGAGDDAFGASAGPDDAAGGAPPAEAPAPVLRAWGPHERARFTPDAWGRLLQLRAAGMGEHEFEHLVDRALLTVDGPVGPAELRALLGDAAGPADLPPETIH